MILFEQVKFYRSAFICVHVGHDWTCSIHYEKAEDFYCDLSLYHKHKKTEPINTIKRMKNIDAQLLSNLKHAYNNNLSFSFKDQLYPSACFLVFVF